MRIVLIRLSFLAIVLLLAAGCARANSPAVPEAAPLDTSSLTDIDGNTYPALQIGEQIWMGASLLATHGPDGEPVESFCYDDQEENCLTYGRLYTVSAAMGGDRGEGAQGICPDDWHIPSMSEWKTLIDHLGGQDTAGQALREQSGLGLQPSGWFDFTGEYRGLGEATFLRSSSAPNSYSTYIWMLEPGSNRVERGDLHPDDAIPLRCIRD